MNPAYAMRLMKPMVTKESCLKCHTHQGYKVGDIRGSVSVSVPNNFTTFNLPILKDYLKAIMPFVDDHAKDNPDMQLFYMPYNEFREYVFKLLENVQQGFVVFEALNGERALEILKSSVKIDMVSPITPCPK